MISPETVPIDRKIRIVHFLNWCREGGTIDMILSLMRRSQHQHIYLTYKASKQRQEEFTNYGLELVEIGSEDRDAAVAFVQENADILHAAHSGGVEPGVLIGCLADKPVIVTCQSPSMAVVPSEVRSCSLYTILVSKEIQSYWSPDFQPYRVIYSCAEPVPKHNKKEAKAHFGFDNSRPVVGRIGRFDGAKRAEDFVHIAQVIWAKSPEVQFLLVGDGRDGDRLRGTVKALNVPIVMPGYLVGLDKELAYNAIDVFLYPTSMEGFGIVFAEAMSLGIPIVTYTDPVNVDVVGCAGVYGVDNLFVDVQDPWNSMAKLTLDLLYNRREYDRLGENGIRRYNRAYTPDRLAKEYDQLYEEVYKKHLDC